MSLRNALSYLLLTALVALLSVRWFSAVSSANHAERDVCLGLDPQLVNQPAKPFELSTVTDGKKVSLASLRGKVVLLHFWFTQCPPCLEELPSLARLRQQLAGTAFQLVTGSVDEQRSTISDFLKEHRLGPLLQVLHDPKKSVSKAYGTEKFPESYLIDRQGQTLLRFVNQRDWSSPIAQACIRSLM